MAYQKMCLYCKDYFESTRNTAKYCCDSCRQGAFREGIQINKYPNNLEIALRRFIKRMFPEISRRIGKNIEMDLLTRWILIFDTIVITFNNLINPDNIYYRNCVDMRNSMYDIFKNNDWVKNREIKFRLPHEVINEFTRAYKSIDWQFI